MSWFASPVEAGERLGESGYLADGATATTAYLVGALEKPLLVEGPAGVGNVLRDLVDRSRHAHWLNPEHRRHWDTGGGAASAYAEIVPMVECRNLIQLGQFVHDLV
jgi:hypothetical protein